MTISEFYKKLSSSNIILREYDGLIRDKHKCCPIISLFYNNRSCSKDYMKLDLNIDALDIGIDMGLSKHDAKLIIYAADNSYEKFYKCKLSGLDKKNHKKAASLRKALLKLT